MDAGSSSRPAQASLQRGRQRLPPLAAKGLQPESGRDRRRHRSLGYEDEDDEDPRCEKPPDKRRELLPDRHRQSVSVSPVLQRLSCKEASKDRPSPKGSRQVAPLHPRANAEGRRRRRYACVPLDLPLHGVHKSFDMTRCLRLDSLSYMSPSAVIHGMCVWRRNVAMHIPCTEASATTTTPARATSLEQPGPSLATASSRLYP